MNAIVFTELRHQKFKYKSNIKATPTISFNEVSFIFNWKADNFASSSSNIAVVFKCWWRCSYKGSEDQTRVSVRREKSQKFCHTWPFYTIYRKKSVFFGQMVLIFDVKYAFLIIFVNHTIVSQETVLFPFSLCADYPFCETYAFHSSFLPFIPISKLL